MNHARRFRAFAFAATTALVCLSAAAQTGDPGTLVQEKLVSQFKLTKPTADRSDIVTQGDIVLLHKDGLMMCSSDSTYAFSNTYKEGVIAQTLGNRTRDFFKRSLFSGGGTDAPPAACPSRKFVAGEKFWITRIELVKDGVVVTTFSDPYPDPSGNQVRYYGELKFPFAKDHVPPPGDFVKTVSEVLTVQPADDSNNAGQGDQGAAPSAPAPPPTPMAAIPPPPPPSDAAPPSISIGQTEAQVTTAFGPPLREAKLGTKKILYYKDMKVTFVHGKVSDVE